MVIRIIMIIILITMLIIVVKTKMIIVLITDDYSNKINKDKTFLRLSCIISWVIMFGAYPLKENIKSCMYTWKIDN